uniref:Uncharacterized protein n=1 Tax=Ditylenchus dipsaci TaxID=166011 RepID=A0A915EMS6_9BILA
MIYKKQKIDFLFPSTSIQHQNCAEDCLHQIPNAYSAFKPRRQKLFGNSVVLFTLLIVLDAFSWPLSSYLGVVAAASSAGPNAYTGQQQNVMFRKRMCFQCHQPFQCTKGFCYGDFCVKSLVAEKYVSKGCENRSSTNTVYSSRSASTKTNGNDGSPFYSSSSLRGEMDPTGCYQMDVFGVPNTICYCSDMDFCNGKKTLTISLLVNFRRWQLY